MPGYAELPAARQPVIVDAVRTPFLNSGGAYAALKHHELAALPLAEIIKRCGLPAEDVELITMGNVVQELSTTNVAREASLAAGFPARIPSYSISMAGVSPNVGVINICDAIAAGRMNIGIAAGTENFSDLPIRMRRPVRQRAVKLATAKSTGDRLQALKGLRPADLLPEVPDSTDLTTGLTMGAACENMAQRFGVSRAQADAYALRSHQNAAKAWGDERYQDVMALELEGRLLRQDEAIRADTSAEKLAGLKPSFRKDGVVTPGNASGLTDGAGAALLMSAEAADKRGFKPLVRVVDVQLGAVDDLNSEMLLGPAMSIPYVLARQGLGMGDVDVFELHEAFAAQILANQQALDSDVFAQQQLGLKQAPGRIADDKLNLWGGSLALGNPFAGTGIRLLSTAARRLQAEGGRYAIVATCAGGGLGSALLLERIGG